MQQSASPVGPKAVKWQKSYYLRALQSREQFYAIQVYPRQVTGHRRSAVGQVRDTGLSLRARRVARAVLVSLLQGWQQGAEGLRAAGRAGGGAGPACEARREQERVAREELRRGRAAVRWFAEKHDTLPATEAEFQQLLRLPQDVDDLVDLVGDAETPLRLKIRGIALMGRAVAALLAEEKQRSYRDILLGPQPSGQVGGPWRASVRGRIGRRRVAR
jgi:hypothetical protein